MEKDFSRAGIFVLLAPIYLRIVSLREIVDLGPLVYLDRTAVDVDDVEAATGQFSSDLRAWHENCCQGKVVSSFLPLFV